MVYLKEFDYTSDEAELQKIREWPFGQNWPVVYIIHNDTDAYVGETLDAVRRTLQHLQEPYADKMKKICIISSTRFNKSVILDLESFLIRYMQVDDKFRLLNGNIGVADSNYYDKREYEEDFAYIWKRLIRLNLAKNPLETLSNLDSFKYSPYKSLTNEQMNGLVEIFRAIDRNLVKADPEHSTILVEGEAGTGKTILAIYLVVFINKLLHKNYSEAYLEFDDIRNSLEVKTYLKHVDTLQKIGFVVPMQSLRATIKEVFKDIPGLSPHMILSPKEVGDDIYHVGKYDLLVVDESHRLHRRKSLSQYPAYDRINAYLGLGQEATELDWIYKRSKMQVLFYDPAQSVRPSDIDRDYYLSKVRLHLATSKPIVLKSQLRCLGGNDYIDYVKDVLYCRIGNKKKIFRDYDLRFFDHVEEMANLIKSLDKTMKLCRLVAGYGWKWLSKGIKDPMHPTDYDIHIENSEFIWNSTYKDWINSPNSVNEVGCIHTVQGYDLNYCGVIFGPEIDYDPVTRRMVIYKEHYFDNLGKAGTNPVSLQEYILNIYATLMTRGIRGTFVYACNPNLQQYLKHYFDQNEDS